MKPTITTVILFFNKPTMTLRCLNSFYEAYASIERENLRFSYDFLLVNNGSTSQNFADFNERLDQRLGNISFLNIPKNIGFSKAMNQSLVSAFEKQNTNHVILSCNDVEVPEKFFLTLESLEVIKNQTHPQILCPHVYYLMDKQKPSYTHGLFSKSNFTLLHALDPNLKEIFFPQYYPAALTIWNRQAFLNLNGFNERFYCYWEDVELSYRASKKNVKILPCPGLKIFHLGRGTTGSKPQYRFHFENGKQTFFQILREF